MRVNVHRDARGFWLLKEQNMRNRKFGQFFKQMERLAFEYVSGNTFNEPVKHKVKTVFALYKHKEDLGSNDDVGYSVSHPIRIFKYHFVCARMYGIKLRPLRTAVYGKCWFVFKNLPKNKKYIATSDKRKK